MLKSLIVQRSPLPDTGGGHQDETSRFAGKSGIRTLPVVQNPFPTDRGVCAAEDRQATAAPLRSDFPFVFVAWRPLRASNKRKIGLELTLASLRRLLPRRLLVY